MSGRLHLTGGTLSNNVNRYLVGIDAINMINNHFATLCFIGASSLNAETGFLTHTNEDAQVKKAIMARSARSVCLADHTKFQKTSFVKFAEPNDFDIIITDDKTPIDQIRAFEEKGVQVIVAKG